MSAWSDTLAGGQGVLSFAGSTANGSDTRALPMGNGMYQLQMQVATSSNIITAMR